MPHMQLAPHPQLDPQGQFLLTHLFSSLENLAWVACKVTQRVAWTLGADLCSTLALVLLAQQFPAPLGTVALTAGTVLLAATDLFILCVLCLVASV